MALVAFGARSARHPAPVVEAALLRVKGTRIANASVFLFSMSFFGLLLGTVLFLTGVWHYSALEAGLAFAPGPLMVALLSWPAGSLAGRVGPRPLAVAGTVLFALGCVWWLWRVGESPAYFTELLPGIIVSGIGVSLTFPVLAGAAVAGLPPDRSATGSALFNMARQIGGVLGVAILVSVLGDTASGLHEFQIGWTFMAAASLAAGAVALLLPRGATVSLSPAPVTVATQPVERGAPSPNVSI